jgi:hypothetical protein
MRGRRGRSSTRWRFREATAGLIIDLLKGERHIVVAAYADPASESITLRVPRNGAPAVNSAPT